MTDREAQIEALWTYEISKEKVLIQIVKKGLKPGAKQYTTLPISRVQPPNVNHSVCKKLL